MGFRDDLKTDAAEAAKEILDDLGETLAYYNKGGSAVNVSGWPRGIVREAAEDYGSEIELERRAFWIPAQTNFPPAAGVNVGDKIVFETVTWYVQEWEADAIRSGFVLYCSRPRTDKQF